jgi:malonyl-ACP O-methyltransferase BioC
MNKNIIEKRFQKNSSTYEQNAMVQREMTGKLVEKLTALCGNTFPRILEIGCGTGFLTGRVVRYLNYKKLYVNDLVPDFRRKVLKMDPGLTFIPGDAEEIALPRSLDLVISSASFQWLEDLPGFVERLAEYSNPGGILAFSTFGPENYREIRELTGKGLDYFSITDFQNILEKEFEVLSLEEEEKKLTFDSGLEVLRHMKRTGVNSLEKTSWGRKEILNFCREYENQFSNKDKVGLTYHPIYAVLRRKR